MAYKVVVSNSANEDLDAILTYIIDKLDNRMAALRIANEVDAVYDSLARHPDMYGFSLDARLAEKGYRRAVIQNYVMLFRVDEGAKQVLIVRFFYGRRDYGKYL